MSKIAYDPVKDKFARIVKKSRRLRRIFYFFLDIIFLRSWHLRRLLKRVGAGFDQKGKWNLLDAGCGFGQYDRFLLENFENISILSIDVKESYLEDNRRYYHDEIEQGRIEFQNIDLLNLEISNKFDLVICIDVLEHIDNDEKAIQNLSAVIKRDGYFLMHSPSHYSEQDAEEDDTFVGEHARTGYSKEEIEKKLMEADLLPIETHYTYSKWGRRAWILSVKWPMIWFTKISYLAFILLLVYYPVVLPFCLLMNFSDLFTKNRKGNGIYALARKI